MLTKKRPSNFFFHLFCSTANCEGISGDVASECTFWLAYFSNSDSVVLSCLKVNSSGAHSDFHPHEWVTKNPNKDSLPASRRIVTSFQLFCLRSDLLSSDYVEIHYEGDKPIPSKVTDGCMVAWMCWGEWMDGWKLLRHDRIQEPVQSIFIESTFKQGWPKCCTIHRQMRKNVFFLNDWGAVCSALWEELQ